MTSAVLTTFRDDANERDKALYASLTERGTLTSLHSIVSRLAIGRVIFLWISRGIS